MGKRGRGNAGKGQRRRGHPRPQGPDSPDRMLDDLAGSLAREAATLENALEAELWASGVEGTWRSRSPLEEEATAAFAEGLVGALERRGGDGARAGLTALAEVGSEPAGLRSAAAVKRLAENGAAEPAWAGALGGATPTAAQLMHDEVFDDGVNVLVEFDHPDGSTSSACTSTTTSA